MKKNSKQEAGAAQSYDHLQTMVDALFEKQEQARELGKSIDTLKQAIKEGALLHGLHDIVGETAKAKISDIPSTKIGYLELKAFLKSRGQSKLLKELISVKVEPFTKIFGESAAQEIGEVTVKPFGRILVTRK
jgi:hypothetical protein